MLSVILSFACAFMILKVVLMLVSCFKTDFEGCMGLLHSKLILACWIKVLHIKWVLQIGWIVGLPILYWSCDLNHIRGRMFPRGRYCNTPHIEMCVKAKIPKFWKFPVDCQSEKRKTKQAVFLITARGGDRPGDLFQSPGRVTKTEGITSRGTQNEPWCQPY